MKHIKRLLALTVMVLALAANAWATDITMTSFSVPNSNSYTGTIKLRLWYTGCSGPNFLASDNTIVMCGNGTSNFYKEMTVSLVSGTLVIPTFTMESTDNSSTPTVLSHARFFVNGAAREFLWQNYIITATMGTPITFPQLYNYQPGSIASPLPSTYLTAAEISHLIVDTTQGIFEEIPAGTINGSNATFTLTRTPVVGSDTVHLNGVQQLRVSSCSAGTESYTIVGAIITHCLPPQTGDSLVVNYRTNSGLIGTGNTTNRLLETSGPAALSLGAILDGQVLKRSGLNIVGSSSYITDTDPRLNTFILANSFAGANICAKINAADLSVAGIAATIYAYGGGDCGTTQVRVRYNHRLLLGAGTYSNSLPTFTYPWILESDSTLEGTGWNTILQESSYPSVTGGSFFVVTTYAQQLTNGGTSRNIHISNLQIAGGKPDGYFQSADQTIALGNCHVCSIDRVYLNQTNAIGLQGGGNALAGTDPGEDLQTRGVTTPLGRYAEDITITNNLMVNVASQNIAISNVERGIISNNIMRAPGQVNGPGVVPIDVEPNVGDRTINILIANNVLDFTATPIDGGGVKVLHGIAVQNGNAAVPFTGLVIQGNTIIGGNSAEAFDRISGAGILVRTAQGVQVTSNTVRRSVYGIKVDAGSSGNTVKDNTLISCSIGGTSAINIEDATYTWVEGNMLYNQPGDAKIGSNEFVSRRIFETGTSNFNTFLNNHGIVSSTGANSEYIAGVNQVGTNLTGSNGNFYFGLPASRPPFVITAGAAKVTDFDADKLDGKDWTATGTIGGTTPAAATFTTLTANTSLVINGGTALTTTNRTGTGNLVLETSPTFVTSVFSPLYRSTTAKLLFQGTGTGPTQLAATQTTVPTCSTNCGTSPTVTGSDTWMRVTMGASGVPASGWVVTFNGTWAAAPACIVQSALSSMVVGKMPIAVQTTTTTITVTTNGTAPATSDQYMIQCGGLQ